ncbi:MAG: hypothetical protein IJK64_06210 [Clostridia bacterium]|nr:hypothetical protein [Clostridia bacterium]
MLQKLGGRDSKAVEKMLEKYDAEIYPTDQARIDELVADSMFEVFNNEQVIRELTGKHAKLTEKLSRRLGQMVQVVNKTLRAMGALRRDDGTALKPEIAALIDDAEALATIRKMMLDGLKQAGENRAAQLSNAGEVAIPAAKGGTPSVLGEGQSAVEAEKNTAGAVQFSRIGWTKDGYEVYETDPAIKTLTRKEQLKLFGDSFFDPNSPNYIGKTIPLIRNAKVEIVVIDDFTYSENVEKINPNNMLIGQKKLIRIGASGDFADVISNAVWYNNQPNKDPKQNEAKKNVNSFDYYKKKFYLDGELHFIRVNIRNKNNGERPIYQVTIGKTKGTPLRGAQTQLLSQPPARVASSPSGNAKKNNNTKGGKKQAKNNPNGKRSTKDADYLAAVKRGDTEAAQKMVDAAAQAAGYRPVARFHQTGKDNDFTRFSTDHPVSGRYDSETPNGIFLKDNDHFIPLGLNDEADTTKQLRFYLKADNLLHFANREEANKWYCENIQGYNELQNEMKAKSQPFTQKLDELNDRWMDALIKNDSAEVERLEAEEDQTYDQLIEIEHDYSEKLRGLLNDYFIGGQSGYDGIELDYDGHRYVDGKRENVHTYVMFDPAQVKSTEPVTYDDDGNVIPLSERFDQSKEDFRYSIKDDIDGVPFVDVEDDILDGTGESYVQILDRIITDKFHRLVIANGQKIVLPKNDTSGKWVFSKDAERLRNNDIVTFEDKIRSFDNADEILAAARDWVGEKRRHNKFKEFARGKVNFRVGGNGYSADVVVGINSKGIAILYDMVNIIPKKITEAPQRVQDQSQVARVGTSAVNNDTTSGGKSQGQKSTKDDISSYYAEALRRSAG